MKTKTVAEPSLTIEEYRDRTWVTRPGPKVDRMACAWLIRRFIDPGARFEFTSRPEDVLNAVPFDMFGAGFSHEADACSFETFMRRFGLADPALARLAQIVHDLDLKDERQGAPEAAAVGRMVEGLCQMYADDRERLEHGMTMFESLYRSFVEHPPAQPGSPASRLLRKHGPAPRRKVRK